jgi:hypothetical protein
MDKLQELAEFLRNATYSDNMMHELDWSLAVLHPRNNDGVVSFNGGIWHRHNAKRKENIKENISISFSFDELNGITGFQLWRDAYEVQGFPFGEKPTFEQFKERVISEFKINELYEPGNKG